MEIQNKLLTLGKNGCLLFCYAYVLDISIEKIINSFDTLVSLRIITDDCYVLDAMELFRFYGINNKRVYKNVKHRGVNIAKYGYKGNTHFVVIFNNYDNEDIIIYNPFDGSECVKNGKIIEWRFIDE